MRKVRWRDELNVNEYITYFLEEKEVGRTLGYRRNDLWTIRREKHAVIMTDGVRNSWNCFFIRKKG